jgi:ARG/rhodanese/phosphatase superfamily protein
MPKHLNNYLKSLTLLSPQSLGNLVIVPVISDLKPRLKYLSVKKAIQKDELIISEMKNSGVVGKIQAENKSDAYVFILDGEQLVGAKQNRIVNISILLKPHSTTILPVSCVEQGRWHFKGGHFNDSDSMLHFSSRSAKSMRIFQELRERNDFSADQVRVWDEVRQLRAEKIPLSKTNAMEDVYENERNKLNEKVKKVNLLKSQVGFIIFEGNKFKGIDIISDSGVFADLYDKILRSHLIENSGKADIILNEEKYLKKARKVLKRFKAVCPIKRKFPGIGRYFGMYSELGVYSLLSFNKQVIHLTAQQIQKTKEHKPDKNWYCSRTPVQIFEEEQKIKDDRNRRWVSFLGEKINEEKKSKHLLFAKAKNHDDENEEVLV